MNLECSFSLASRYKSASQIARVLTEHWCARELYCPACDCNRLSASTANTPAVDFSCPYCNQLFQLKALRQWNSRKIVDAGYEAMIRSIRADRIPNLFLLHYSSKWNVENLLLVPRMFFSETVIEKRKPLAPTARRAGWVGCNILLNRIPRDGKIPLVADGVAVTSEKVRREYSRVKKLAEIPASVRGWTLDVLNVVRKLKKAQFSLAEMYAFTSELSALHPQNQNVRPKIRQQLQVLRDLGLVEFLGRGRYEIPE
jgi:type II restriction enzyme